MALTPKPDLLTVWAEVGASVSPSASKISDGWVGEIPTYQNFNWVMNRSDQYLKHLDEHGIPQWSTTSEYSLGAVTLYATDDRLYQSLQDNNINNFPTDSAFWKVMEFYKLDGTSVMQDGQHIKAKNNYGLVHKDTADTDAEQTIALWDSFDDVYLGNVSQKDFGTPVTNDGVRIKVNGIERLVLLSSDLNLDNSFKFGGADIYHTSNFTIPPLLDVKQIHHIRHNVNSSGSLLSFSYPSGMTYSWLSPGIIQINHFLNTLQYVVVGTGRDPSPSTTRAINFTVEDYQTNRFTVKLYESGTAEGTPAVYAGFNLLIYEPL